ncbi:MAG TPA: HAD-IA family hydrolase [Ramlibacter sp.]|nr:HAD-IA family hydrolase [Ramlibacter sp.]
MLFDFDGTLADTAPDLGAAVNHLRAHKGLAPLSVDAVRPFASMGARGMLRVAFGLKPGDPEFAPLKEAFLDRYDERVCVETTLFPGVRELLAALEGRGIRWGIITNKSTRFTGRIVERLELAPSCIVCGDSTPHLKPHPAPMHLAAGILEIEEENCYYLGDDLRDVQAARAAGMKAVAVAWGYLNPDNGEPRTWNADLVLSRPGDLVPHL